MKFNYEGNSQSPGIYKIINTISGRIYIGQAKSFKQRWYGHSRSLRSGKHQNKFIQNDFNKCLEQVGNDDFLEFHVIEVMDNSTKAQRKEQEEHWINQFYDKQISCYNFHKTASGNERSCYSLTPEDTSKKLSQSLKNFMETNPEHKRKSIEQLMKNQLNPQVIEKIDQARRDRWKDPEFHKKQVERVNEPEYRKKLSSNAKTLWNDPEYRKNNKGCSKHFHVVSPEGKHYEGVSLKKFCRENNLSYDALQKVVREETNKTITGWTKG
jgi:group I intron endonuclease